jgi:hypothetical protein
MPEKKRQRQIVIFFLKKDLRGKIQHGKDDHTR